MEVVMTQMNPKTVVVATSTFACAALLSFGWSEQRGVSLSIESAQARVGRPLTPVSVAGVARRQNRRAAYGYGAGVVGAGLGAAAIGTAAAVGAATSPWGWRGDPYYTGTGYYGGGGAWGARAAYVAPATASVASAWSLRRAYYENGPWYGYSGWDDYAARGGIVCKPGTLVKADNGLNYPCQ
jgi:hypothetical protein